MRIIASIEDYKVVKKILDYPGIYEFKRKRPPPGYGRILMSLMNIFNFSGHGHFDLSAYDAYMGGKLEDYEYPDEKIKESLKDLPKV